MNSDIHSIEQTSVVPRIRAYIVEDQGMMRSFFERWLAGLPTFVLTGSARSGEEAMLQIESAKPDVMLADYQLPGMDGLEFMRAARQVRPQLRTLIVSSLTDPIALTRIHEAGAEGYVEKDASPDVLREALQCIAAGQRYFSEKFQETISKESALAEGVGKILSRREQQILTLLLMKKSNREMADQIGLSIRTVEFHRGNLMTKLVARNYAELVQAAQLRGWS